MLHSKPNTIHRINLSYQKSHWLNVASFHVHGPLTNTGSNSSFAGVLSK